MIRKVLVVLAVTALPLLLLVTVKPGVASANTLLPGSVTCNPSGGAWSGGSAVVTFSPPLLSGGVASHETVTVGGSFSVKFGPSSPCGASALSPPTVLGALQGKLKFHTVDANSCSTIFSGNPLTPTTPSKFTMKWFDPNGVPTVWKKPSTMSVTGAANMTDMTITGGKLTGSFASYPTPNVTLSDTSWTPANIGAACSGGLSSLTLGTSSGAW